MFRTLIGRVVATALLAGTALVVAPSAAQATDDEPTACQQVWDSFPTAMQDDIKAAVPLPLRPRRHALRAIRYAALHGNYGEDVQMWAQQVRQHRQEIWKQLPDRLKADIVAARSLPLREQRRAVLAIRSAALHGVYGDWVRSLAEKRRAFVRGCPGVARPFVGTPGLVA